MPTRFLLLAILVLLTASCGGGDKRFPSSNPPEYDPNKVYSIPTAPSSPPAVSPAKPAEPELPPIQLPSLEPGPNEKGEWRKVPLKPESLQRLKGAKTTCEALSRMVQGLGSAQLFAGREGESLKKAFGSQAESIARTLDQQLTETFKKQLGPSAGNCPSLAPPHKSSSNEDSSQQARIVRTSGASNSLILLAQTTAPQGEKDGYTVTKSQQVQEAPPGWVGRKTTDRSSEVGNKPETAGNRKNFVLIVGGKVLKCPTSDGVVPGDFEFVMVLDQTINESGVTRMVHYGRRVDATLKGQTGDDAKLQYVDLDASIVSEQGGTDVPTSVRRKRVQVRFVPNHDIGGIPTEFSNWSATAWDSGGIDPKESAAADYLLLAVMVFSGPLYMQAEAEWVKPNTCVEIIFTPASKQRKQGPNESVKVQAELRTKKEQAVVPAKFLNAVELPTPNNGKVSPTQAEAKPGAPAIFTYTAPSKRVRGSGFQVDALSRAGTADGKWEAATDVSYLLELQSVMIFKPLAQSHASALVRLEAQGEDAADDEPSYSGQGKFVYKTEPFHGGDPCGEPIVRGEGTTVFTVYKATINIVDPQDSSGVSKGGSANIELLYGVPDTGETLTIKCSSRAPIPFPFWSGRFISGRIENFDRGPTGLKPFTPEEGFLLKDWTYVGQNGVVATKTFKSTCNSNCDQEIATFTLREGSGSEVTPPQ